MLVKSFSKLKKFKVLVGTPHNEIKNYCFDDFLANVTNFTYKNYKYASVYRSTNLTFGIEFCKPNDASTSATRKYSE